MHKGALYLDGPGGTGKTFVYRALCARLRRPGLIVIWVVSTGVDALFGGLPPVLGGDWAQTLPVVRNGSRTDVYRACLPATPIWKSPRKWTLTENMRVSRNPATCTVCRLAAANLLRPGLADRGPDSGRDSH